MSKLGPCRVPSYRKHKATGQAVVTLNGQDHYLGKYGTASSREDYNRFIAEWLVHGRRLPQSKAGLTVNDLILAYARHALEYYRQSPKEVEKIKLSMRPLKELHGRTEATEFGPLSLKVVRQRMIDQRLARRTINIRIGVIKRMFKWGVENELIPPSIFHGLQAVPGLKAGRSEVKETPPIKPVADVLVDGVLPFVSRPVQAMIELQRLTGARSGEIVIMRSCDIDMTGRVWIYRPATHKNLYRGHQREIFLGPKAQEIIRPFFTLDTQAFLFSPAEAREERFRLLRERRKTKVQPSQVCRKKKNPQKKPGARYTVESYRRAITQACARAFPPPDGLAAEERAQWYKDRHWHPHQLRHNAATSLRKGYGVELARIILGHKTAFTTEIYAEADKVQAMEVMAKIG
jgi:integrase